jgi:hypothetical protein
MQEEPRMHGMSLGKQTLLATAIVGLFTFLDVASTAKAVELANAKKAFQDKCAK